MSVTQSLKSALVPFAVIMVTAGMILLLMFISSIIPWGMGKGCWAQC